MRGDFSRIRYNSEKHYTSVLQLQGRVALDADANEQCAINEHIRDTEMGDIVGPFGGPVCDPGFAITINNDNTITVGSGRYYANGILCENKDSLPYTGQQFLINPSPTDVELLGALKEKNATAIRVYLEVWQRLVTALDDPCLREPALGQADTTARWQVVWRVVAETFPTQDGQPVVEDCCTAMYGCAGDGTAGGKLSAQTSGGSTDCSCEPTPQAGYRGLENQLYRIEIHKGGNENTATFKWSRENGSVVAAIKDASGSMLQVDSLGPDENLGFQANNWVELSDDTDQFGQPPNQPGDLVLVQKPVPEKVSLSMQQAVSGIDTAQNARVRRWDQFGASAGSDGIPVATNWIDLENGIQIQFSTGNYSCGDHWLIPARTATGLIEWPPCGSDGASFQPPHRTKIHRAPLACIHWDGTTFHVEDCRRIFPPLTPPQALHVTGINWGNDEFVPLDQFIQPGLQVTLDQMPDSTVSPSTFIVIIELPYALNLREQAALFNPPPGAGAAFWIPRMPIILDGLISTGNGPILVWTLTASQLFAALQTSLQSFALGSVFARVRVRLLGHAIFKNIAACPRIYLDGQSFAVPYASGGSGLDLIRPSGNGVKSSDFESWFYVFPPVTYTMTITPAAVKVIRAANGFSVVGTAGANLNKPVTPTATLHSNFSIPVDTQVSVTATGGGVVAVPKTVILPRNSTSVSFPVTVQKNPGVTALTFQISASFPAGYATAQTAQAKFTATGFKSTTVRVPRVQPKPLG
jgi:hypothetical protein